jgi:protein-disulfide isomerase
MSGKNAKRQRRVERPPAPAGEPRGRKASAKVIAAVAAAIAAVVVGVVLAVSLSGGSSPATTDGAKLPGAAEVQALFTGIPQKSSTLGAASAPVTMVEYIDLQCPYCQEFESTVLPKLVKTYVRPGKVRIEQRLLAFIGPDSVRGRSAALAAGLQNKQFNFSEILYLNQGTENTGWLDDKLVAAAASSIPGLDVPQLLTDATSSRVSNTAKALDAEATAAGIDSTPTILVGKTGTQPKEVQMSSPGDYASVAAAIESALPG